VCSSKGRCPSNGTRSGACSGPVVFSETHIKDRGTLFIRILVFIYALTFREGALPVAPEWWPGPTDAELEEANGDRHYPPNEDAVLTLDVESFGLCDFPVADLGSDEDLD
jgi:hypothetical protein